MGNSTSDNVVTYLVDFSADLRGERVLGVKKIDLIKGYSSFTDIPKILEVNFGYKNIVIISATLAN